MLAFVRGDGFFEVRTTFPAFLAGAFRATFVARTRFATPAGACATLAGAFFAAVEVVFLPAELSFRFALVGLRFSLDAGCESPAEGRPGFPEDDCELTASLARVTAARAF